MAVKSKKLPAHDQYRIEPDSDHSPVELGFVIDQSLSMLALQRELVTCFNALLADQVSPNTSASLLLFNDSTTTLANGLPISQIQKLNDLNYSPDSNTALLDAIGAAANLIGPRFDRSPSRVLIAIFTDGFENSSTIFSQAEITNLISFRQSASDWRFLFVTPKEGLSFALSLGIPRDHIVDFETSTAGLRRVLAKLSRSLRAYRLGSPNYPLLLQS